MTKVKSFSVGNGDMFYIKHGSSNFTIIDCFLSDDNKKTIVDELKNQSSGKDITRFISTHPDEDHIQQLDYLAARRASDDRVIDHNNGFAFNQRSNYVQFKPHGILSLFLGRLYESTSDITVLR